MIENRDQQKPEHDDDNNYNICYTIETSKVDGIYKMVTNN